MAGRFRRRRHQQKTVSMWSSLRLEYHHPTFQKKIRTQVEDGKKERLENGF